MSRSIPKKYTISEARVMVLIGPQDPDQVLRLAKSVLEGGGRLLQLRQKNRPREETRSLAQEIVPLCRSVGAGLILNDDPALAVEVGADGAHIGQEDLSATEARKILGPNRLLGISAHSQAEIEAALAAGADYLGIGTVFASSTKDQLIPQGLSIVSLAARICPIPFYAIGGIDESNLESVLRAGAWGVAVSRAGAAIERLRGMVEG